MGAGAFLSRMWSGPASEDAGDAASPDLDSSQSATDLDAVRADAAKGRVPRAGAVRRATKSEATLALIEKQEKLDKLLQPKHFRKISSLYFDLRYVQTGDEEFQLEDEDADSLSESLTVMMQTLVELDPKYLSALVFTSTFASIVIKKEAQHRRKVALARARVEMAKRGPAPGPGPIPSIAP